MASRRRKSALRGKAHTRNWVKKLSEHMKSELKKEVPVEKKHVETADSSNTQKEVKCCVILKKIPEKCNENDIRNRMKRFGAVKKVLLVRPKLSKTHLGTAFVYFKSLGSAEKVFQRSRDNYEQSENTNNDVINAPFITLNSHKIECHEVRDTPVQKIPAKEEDKKDLRNLYLFAEGQIDENKHDVSKSDMAIRKLLYRENLRKLRAPTFHVSRTRLNIRNIPHDMNEASVKQLFRTYGKIKQVKLLRNTQGNSKGCGFLEYLEHASALNALRKLNNNPDVWGRKSRPIVQFAIDDISVLQKRRMKYGSRDSRSLE